MPAFDTYIVNAFVTDTPFSGNPAGVCLLNSEADPDWMQALAANLNLSETAFLHQADGLWEIRYFTPTAEVPLCGHATLASGAVLFDAGLAAGDATIRFRAQKDLLELRQSGDRLSLRLPRYSLANAAYFDEVEAVTGKRPSKIMRTASGAVQEWLYAIFDDEALIAGLTVDQDKLSRSSLNSLCVSAQATGRDDYVLRFFSPKFGIPEDPVTGAAQCGLAGYWGELLGKSRLQARQLSARGGCFDVSLEDKHIELNGRCAIIMKGLRCF